MLTAPLPVTGVAVLGKSVSNIGPHKCGVAAVQGCLQIALDCGLVLLLPAVPRTAGPRARHAWPARTGVALATGAAARGCVGFVLGCSGAWLSAACARVTGAASSHLPAQQARAWFAHGLQPLLCGLQPCGLQALFPAFTSRVCKQCRAWGAPSPASARGKADWDVRLENSFPASLLLRCRKECCRASMTLRCWASFQRAD